MGLLLQAHLEPYRFQHNTFVQIFAETRSFYFLSSSLKPMSIGLFCTLLCRLNNIFITRKSIHTHILLVECSVVQYLIFPLKFSFSRQASNQSAAARSFITSKINAMKFPHQIQYAKRFLMHTMLCHSICPHIFSLFYSILSQRMAFSYYG